jgi:hypothetical protein
MIIDIPDAESFETASIGLMNLAWKIAVELIRTFEEADGTYVFINEEWSEDERQKAEDAFWARSQLTLGNALALIQQSIETALKGKIASVSPYLLIVRDPRDYPSGSDKKDISFSAFRTIDAADLFRVHNTICHEKLDDDFRKLWDDVRSQRNQFIHAVNAKGDHINPVDLLEYILLTSDSLYPTSGWISKRLRYLENNDLEAAYLTDQKFSYGSMLSEFGLVVENIQPAIARGFFGFDRRQRCYICPLCLFRSDQEAWWDEDSWEFAQLRPKSAKATKLFCTFCHKTIPVLRIKCRAVHYKCPSNVLSDDDETRGLCLICRHKNDTGFP